MKRKILFCLGAVSSAITGLTITAAESQRPNILLLVADDLNYNSVGAFGSPVRGATPHIDQLAAEGIRFTHAHVNVAVCQPSRGVIMTGMYGHQSGIEGFELYQGTQLQTLTEYLRDAGYETGILGKVDHSLPKSPVELQKFAIAKDQLEIGLGRDPLQYESYAREFFDRVKQEKKPFFFMVNSRDPHRPFAGSDDEQRNPLFKQYEATGKKVPDPSKVFTADEVTVPGFLPDLPNVRKEIAQYYSSVRRLDDMIGAVLRVLNESGFGENTLIVFISDNGMAFPYSKTNCYLNSTKTPFIAKWSGVIKPGTDSLNFISGVDFLPTFLEAAHVKYPSYLAGKSFLPLLKGQKQTGRDLVFTQFYETSQRTRYPMRAVQNRKFGYIYNPWADGTRQFRNESMMGLTFNAMKEAAVTDALVAERVVFYLVRTREEFYDIEKDPDALHNLIQDPAYKQEIDKMRALMEKWMQQTGDPALDAFKNRDDGAIQEKFMKDDDARAKKRQAGLPQKASD